MQPPSSSAVLIDAFGRRIDYLRVSITDRCDLRCTYCLPKGFTDFAEPESWMTHGEMERLVGLFIARGVSKVRITGGEPLLRRGVTEFATAITRIPGLTDLSLSTNGTQLARQAQALRAAGVKRLNISLDSLDAACFARITGRDCLEQVLSGISAAQTAGFSPIKLNAVIPEKPDLNQINELVEFALQRGLVLRLIETMPIGDTGRQGGYCDVSALGRELAARYGLLPELQSRASGPARYWTSPDGSMSLGAITPMSRHFCETCNRVRLSVEGTLYLCLGQENQVPLGSLLRSGATDADLQQAITAAIAAKPERHEFLTQPQKIIRFMAQTGG